MRNKMKLFGTLVLTIIFSALLGVTIVNAESVASSLTIKSSDYKNPPMSFPQTFHVKKTSSGKWAYCITYAKKTPYSGVKYTKNDIVDDKGKYYILKEAQKNVKSNSDFFIYQTALWIYMSDKGIMSKSNSVSTFRKKVYNSNSATAKKIRSIVAAAKKAPKIDKSAPTIKLTASKTEMTLSGNQYVSSKIKLTSSTSSYKITLTNAPKGTTYKVSGGYLYVYVPAASITKFSESFKVTASNSKTIYNSQNYKPSNSKYQKMAVTFTDTKKASSSVTLTIVKGKDVQISKQAITGTKELPGATLVLKDASGKQIDKWVSTTTTHHVKGLKAGTYTLTEITSPDGYSLSTETIKFTLDKYGKLTDANGKSIDKVVMKNAQNETKISKKDITTNKELSGATLVVKDASGKVIDKWVSTTEDHIIKGLKVGTYTLSETITPKGYIETKETVVFNIDKYGKLTDKNSKSIDKVVMYNTPQKEMNIKISKQDVTTKKELPGATLVVKDASGKVIDTWVSTTENHIIKYIVAGTYTLTETVAPKGYKLSNEEVKFTVDKDGKLTDEFGKSIDRVVMYNELNDNKKELNVKISKQDITTKKGLSGAALTVVDSQNKVIDTWVSTTEDHIINDIQAGTYTLKETQAPNGYELSTEIIKFTVSDEGKITDENGKAIDRVIMYNKPATEKKVTISKQDIATSKELPGASLVVKDSNGNVVDSWVSTTEAHIINDIKAGTYTLTETQAPNGYILSTETIKFTIDEAGKLTDESGNEIDKVVMLNKRIPKTNVTISKQDITTSKELPGASLVVKDSNGNIVDTWVSTNESHIIKDLTEGTYTLTETQAPDGYILSTETITFKVDENSRLVNSNGNHIDKVIMYNEKEVKPFNVPIIKQDAKTHKNVSEANLNIKDSNGEIIDSWTTTNEAHYIELKAGTYTLTETQAPTGYILNNTPITFNVTEDGKLTDANGNNINEIIMNNTPVETKVSISKQDITNGKEIPGAKLVVKDVNGNVIDSWTSTTTPHLITGLVPGEYTLNEVIAPNGYILSDETIRFTVNADGSITKVVMYNSPKTTPTEETPKPTAPAPTETPKTTGQEIKVENTASAKTIVPTLFGGLSIGLGTFRITRKRKKESLI